MQNHVPGDLADIDAAMMDFPRYGTGELAGIDVSPIRRGTRERMRRTHAKHQTGAIEDSSGLRMLESFEPKMMPSTLLHPLSDSSFAMTLKNGATMSDGVFETHGGTAEITENAALDFGTADFTVSTSVQFQRNGEIEMIVFKNAREPRSKGFGLWRVDNGTVNAMLNDGNGNYLTLNSIGKITDTTQFHDVSMVRKNGILGLWIDGVEQQTRVLEGAQGNYDVTSPAPLILGKTDNGYYQLQAKIKDLLIAKGALTPTDIAKIQQEEAAKQVSTAKTTTTETYVDQQMLSFSDLPNGTYGKGWNFFALKDGTKIKVFNDEASILVENGTIRTQKPNGESSWIWIGFEDGVARKVINLDMRYNPNAGGSAQPKITFGSNDNDNRKVALTSAGLFPINQMMTRAVIETFEHQGTAIAGIEVEVTKTREVASTVQKPAASASLVSESTLSQIATVVANQNAQTTLPPLTVETPKPAFLHPLSNAAFAVTLKNGATMSQGIFSTHGGIGEISQNAALDFGAADFTISATIQFQRNNEIEMILFKIQREPQVKGFGLRKMNDNTIQGFMNDGNGHYLSLNTVGTITDTTQFHDISMVRKNNILGLWIDGVEQQTKVTEGAQATCDITSSAPVIIGRTDNGYYPLEANIKDLMVAKGAFTPAEILKIQQEEAVKSVTVQKIAEAIVSKQTAEVMRPLAPEVDPHAPFLRAVGIQGSNITLAVASPMLGGNTVMFAGLHDDGVFTNTRIEGVSDGSITPVTLGMNAANPTGDYSIVLIGGAEARTLSSIRVHWDYDTKKLSLCGGTTLWTCTEAQGRAMNEQMQEVLELSKNPTVGSGALANMQQESMIDGVRSLSSFADIAPDFESKFWSAHPEWKDDAIHERAIQESRTTRYSATQVFERIVTQRNDTMGILRSDYSKFHGMLGDLLQQALTVLSGIRSGGNEPNLRHNFALVVDRAATSLPMFRLASIGIRLPDAGTLLEAVKEVWNVRCDEILQVKAGEAKIAAQQIYQAQLVANGRVQAADGTWVAKTDPRATTGLVYYTDPQGRLTLIPQETNTAEKTGTTYGLDMTDVTFVASQNTLAPSVYESIGLKLTNGEFHKSQELSIHPTKFGEITFEITQNSMVNLWTKGSLTRSLSLSIQGGSLPKDGYNTLSKTGISGDSISLQLTPGNYTLRVQDQTNYTNAALPNYVKTPFSATVGVEISKFSSSKIEGKISIDGNAEIMPVSMSVAEFDAITGKRRETPNHGLDSSKPVWVVVHGMNSKENAGNINEAIKALINEGGIQVVSIDWNLAAKDATKTGLDVAWTDSVGQWVAQQLVNAGFSPAMINGWGHSHGTYVLDAMGIELMKLKAGAQMNTIIASDPAGNVPLWTGYDHTKINFSDVSMRSIAFESSFIADSDFLAGTADIAFHINGPSEFGLLDINGSPKYGPIEEHSLGLTTVTAILKHEKGSPGDFSKLLSFQAMTHFTQEDIDKQYSRNSYRGRFEGTIDVDATMIPDGETQYLQGTPKRIHYKKDSSEGEQVINFTTFA